MTRVLARGVVEQRTVLAILAVAAAGFNVLIAYTFQAVGGTQGVEALFSLMPEGIRAFLKAWGGLDFTANGYMASLYRHPIYLILLLGYVIAVASRAVAREIEQGTILLLLARPIARYRVLLARTLTMLLGVVVLLAAALIGTWMGSVVNGFADELDMMVFLAVQLNGLLLALAVGWISMLISAVSSEGGRVVALATGLAVMSFFIDFLAEIWEAAAFLGPLSLFRYYDPVGVAGTGGLPWRDLAVLGAVAALALAASLVAFQRRDISR